MSIPLNNIVKINPSVLGVGNNGNNLFGLMLTDKPVLPDGQITTFTTATQVSKIFSEDSKEYELASVYFSGFTNSDRVAAQLYVAPYYTTTPPSTVIGGSLGSMTLDDLRTLTGNLSIDVTTGESVKTYTAQDENGVDLTDATSFSDAASLLQLQVGGSESPFNITFSVATGSMVITMKGAEGKITAVSGDIADSLRLSESTRMTSLSDEENVKQASASDGDKIVALLNKLRQQNLSFCSVFLAWDEENRDTQLRLAKWANSMKDDVCVILNDTDKKAYTKTQGTDPKDDDLSIAEYVRKYHYEGVVCVYNNLNLCAFIAGYPAAWDLTKSDGRFTAAFRRNSLLVANVTDEETALVLKAKGYNFYGIWASSTSNFTFMYEGKISGQYEWLDSWFCQVWMRRQLQYYFIMTLLARGQIPYNTDGKGILTTAIKPAIDQYLSFGAIRSGVSLADEQVQQLKQAGLNQSQINNITTVGYYLKVDMERVTPQTRVKRGSPPINFWYTDGQSVQQINMNSIEIQ